MNIIFLREADASGRPRTVTVPQLMVGAAALFGFLPLVLGGALFWWVHVHEVLVASSAPGESVSVTGRALGEVRTLKVLSHRDLGSLALTVGRLRAQASRLDALSSRLSAIAGLPVGLIRFPETDALSDHMGVQASAPTVTGLMTLAEHLRAAFTHREMQFSVLASILAAHRVVMNTTPGGWPVRGGWISSPFGPRPDPFTGRPGFHPGVDIAAPAGTPVRAMAAGVVIFAGGDGGFGRLVKIFDGHSEITMYAHLSARYVHVGEVIHKGELLGRVGDTGYSTGPHLHFEVLLHGAPVNPIRFLHIADRR